MKPFLWQTLVTPSLDADVAAWVSACVANGGDPPSVASLYLMTQMVQLWKAAGVWSAADGIWFHGANTGSTFINGLVEMKTRRLGTPGGDFATGVGQVPYSCLVGTGNSNTSIDTQFAFPIGIFTWAQSTGYTAGQYAVANGNRYFCKTTGTSSSMGTGPSGTGSSISDGSCSWNYVQALPNWAANTAYTASTSRVIANGNQYLCTQSGTSASAGSGPDGGGTAITDGTCNWAYVPTYPNWAQSTAYFNVSSQVYANGNQYQCSQAGTSASSGTGPSGTGSGIVDGTCHWNYIQPIPTWFANAVLNMMSVGVYYQAAAASAILDCGAFSTGSIVGMRGIFGSGPEIYYGAASAAGTLIGKQPQIYGYKGFTSEPLSDGAGGFFYDTANGTSVEYAGSGASLPLPTFTLFSNGSSSLSATNGLALVIVGSFSLAQHQAIGAGMDAYLKGVGTYIPQVPQTFGQSFDYLAINSTNPPGKLWVSDAAIPPFNVPVSTVTASISGTTLTTSALLTTPGTTDTQKQNAIFILNQNQPFPTASGLAPGTQIINVITPIVAGVGVYTVNIPQTLSSRTITIQANGFSRYPCNIAFSNPGATTLNGQGALDTLCTLPLMAFTNFNRMWPPIAINSKGLKPNPTGQAGGGPIITPASGGSYTAGVNYSSVNRATRSVLVQNARSAGILPRNDSTGPAGVTVVGGSGGTAFAPFDTVLFTNGATVIVLTVDVNGAITSAVVQVQPTSQPAGAVAMTASQPGTHGSSAALVFAYNMGFLDFADDGHGTKIFSDLLTDAFRPPNIPAWAQSTAYGLNTSIFSNGNQYLCVQTGVSSGSGTGPTGVSAGITDGTCKWNYANAASASSTFNVFGYDTALIGTPSLATQNLNVGTGGICVTQAWMAANAAAIFTLPAGAGQGSQYYVTTDIIILPQGRLVDVPTMVPWGAAPDTEADDGRSQAQFLCGWQGMSSIWRHKGYKLYLSFDPFSGQGQYLGIGSQNGPLVAAASDLIAVPIGATKVYPQGPLGQDPISYEIDYELAFFGPSGSQYAKTIVSFGIGTISDQGLTHAISNATSVNSWIKTNNGAGGTIIPAFSPMGQYTGALAVSGGSGYVQGDSITWSNGMVTLATYVSTGAVQLLQVTGEPTSIIRSNLTQTATSGSGTGAVALCQYTNWNKVISALTGAPLYS